MEGITKIINENIAYFFTAFTLVLVIFSAWNAILSLKLRNLKKKNADFFSGSKIKNLDELILAQTKNLKLLDKDIQELYNISNQINGLALRGFHKMGLIRFNPFKDVGGNQSFSLALLNGKNNGFTISSLFTREGARVYSKAITGGVSEEHPLTEEEKKAIEIAMQGKIFK